MSETANIELAQRLISAYVAADENEVEALVSVSYRDHAPRPIAVGHAGARESLRWLRSTFAERAIDVEDIVAAQDRVVARVRFSATHVGELEGIAATGRRIETEHVHIWRVAGDRLAEHWMVRDDLTVLRQLGARIEGS
jgi:predicted ester cyclase